MAVRSAAQVHLYFALFLAFWRLNWSWKLLTGTVAVILAVYYLPWPFDASHGALWVDALFSACCALLSSRLIPTEEKGKPCKLCYFFCLVAIPAGVLGYASVYIPQTNFPLGIYLATMVATGLCTVLAIACPHALSYWVLIPGSVFIWAMIAPNIRFLPVSLAFGLSIAMFAFREESLQKRVVYEQRHASGTWVAHADSMEDLLTSSEESEGEYVVVPSNKGPYQRRVQVNQDDLQLRLEYGD